MATLALGQLGTVVGGPLGGFIGGAIGAYIDNVYLFPALFPPEDIKGPRLGELQLQAVDEGSPIFRCYGPEIKVPGTLLWVGDIIEVKREEEVGGKGGGGGGSGQKVINYEYFIDVGVGVCHGTIIEFTEIWADSKKVYNEAAPVSIASTQISVETWETYVPFSGTVDQYFMRLKSPNGGPDLTQLKSGVNVTTAGFVNAGNNGTRKCSASKLNGDGSTQADLIDDDTAVDESAGASVTITQPVEKYDKGKVQQGFNLYLGDGSQTADPKIEAAEGAGNVPGFRHIAYFVAKRIALASFGNRIPNFRVLVKAQNSPKKVKDVVGEIIELSELTASDYDVSEVDNDLVLTGYALRGPQPPTSALGPLLIGYDLLVTESNGKLVFRDRFDQKVKDIDPDLLTAHSPGQDTNRLASIAKTPGIELPDEMNVAYIDNEKDQDRGSAREKRRLAPSKNVQQIDLPIVLTGDQAREIAKRELWKAWINSKTISFTLPQSQFVYEENDRLRLPIQGVLYSVLISRVTQGNNGLINFEATVEDAQVLEQTATTDPTFPGDFAAYIPPVLELQIFDVSGLTDAHTRTAGYYVACCARDFNAFFVDALAYQSLDEGENYQQIYPINTEVTVGRSLTTIQPGAFGWFDSEQTLDVELFEGTLESREVIEVLNGMNRAIIGNEIIGFVDATLIGVNQYRLSTLLRGLRGTEVNMSGVHKDETGVRFVLLNSAGIGFIPMSLNSVGTQRLFKAVPWGEEDLDNVDPVTFELEGGTIKPWAPCQLAGSRDGSNNLTVSWVRRTRSIKRLFSAQQDELLERRERYDVYFPNVGFTARLKTVEDATSVVYTAAEQTADGLTPGNPVDVQIWQLSDTIGRGRMAEATV